MTQQKQKTQPVAITPRYEEILSIVHECRYVLVPHITSLLYAPSSKTHVNEILGLLAGGDDKQSGHYLYRFPRPKTGPGNTERIYTLGTKGISYLRDELGIDVPWRFDASKIQSLSYGYLQHQLDETSFFIAAKRLSKAHEQTGRDPLLHTFQE